MDEIMNEGEGVLILLCDGIEHSIILYEVKLAAFLLDEETSHEIIT
jgi:hypothetical protein